jgi:hypothetical protein
MMNTRIDFLFLLLKLDTKQLYYLKLSLARDVNEISFQSQVLHFILEILQRKIRLVLNLIAMQQAQLLRPAGCISSSRILF